MEMLAVSDEVWIAGIGAVVTIFGAWLAAWTAVKREASRFTTLANEIADKVEVVRHATNSLTDQLVAKTEKEALARGGTLERERADAKAKV